MPFRPLAGGRLACDGATRFAIRQCRTSRPRPFCRARGPDAAKPGRILMDTGQEDLPVQAFRKKLLFLFAIKGFIFLQFFTGLIEL